MSSILIRIEQQESCVDYCTKLSDDTQALLYLMVPISGVAHCIGLHLDLLGAIHPADG